MDLDSLGIDLDSLDLDLDSVGVDTDSLCLDLDSLGQDLDSLGLDLDVLQVAGEPDGEQLAHLECLFIGERRVVGDAALALVVGPV